MIPTLRCSQPDRAVLLLLFLYIQLRLAGSGVSKYPPNPRLQIEASDVRAAGPFIHGGCNWSIREPVERNDRHALL